MRDRPWCIYETWILDYFNHEIMLLNMMLVSILSVHHTCEQIHKYAQPLWCKMTCFAMRYHIWWCLLPMWLFPRSVVWYLRLEEAMSLWCSKVISFSFLYQKRKTKWGTQGSKWDLCFPQVQSYCRRRRAEPWLIHGDTLTVKRSCQGESWLIKDRRVPLICSAVLLSLPRREQNYTLWVSWQFQEGEGRKDRRSLCIFSLWKRYTQTRRLDLNYVRTASASLALSKANCSVHSTLLQ